MKFLATLGFLIAGSLFAASALAANTIPKDMLEDAEYMMRKVVEDIHAYQLKDIITDQTLDRSIKVVGRVQKFDPAKRDVKTGEMYSCAIVSLKTNIKANNNARKNIKRIDEICKGNSSGRVTYIVYIK
ncbi:MAG: hypothetical protein JKY04_01105 [Sneathiella sp.]|nr:hypothetical protein [Sneathiella sp.]